MRFVRRQILRLYRWLVKCTIYTCLQGRPAYKEREDCCELISTSPRIPNGLPTISLCKTDDARGTRTWFSPLVPWAKQQIAYRVLWDWFPDWWRGRRDYTWHLRCLLQHMPSCEPSSSCYLRNSEGIQANSSYESRSREYPTWRPSWPSDCNSVRQSKEDNCFHEYRNSWVSNWKHWSYSFTHSSIFPFQICGRAGFHWHRVQLIVKRRGTPRTPWRCRQARSV